MRKWLMLVVWVSVGCFIGASPAWKVCFAQKSDPPLTWKVQAENLLSQVDKSERQIQRLQSITDKSLTMNERLVAENRILKQRLSYSQAASASQKSEPPPPTLTPAQRLEVHEYSHDQDGLQIESEKLNTQLETDPEVKAFREKQLELKKQQDALSQEGNALEKKLEGKYPTLKAVQEKNQAMLTRGEALKAKILKELKLDPAVYDVRLDMGGAVVKKSAARPQ